MLSFTTTVVLFTLVAGALGFPTILTARPSKGKSFVATLQRHAIERRDIGLAAAYALPQQYISKRGVPVLVGGQKFTLLVDTGSVDFWVYGPQANNPLERSVYDPSLSSTSAVKDGQSFNIRYGPGFGTSGTLISDSLNVGGATAPAMNIELADAVGDAVFQCAFAAVDGFLGLAFKYGNAIALDKSPTFMEMDSTLPRATCLWC